MHAFSEEQDIAASLPQTWSPFFQRFGRLRPVQVQAIPPLLAGRDAVICSPTSSGKTEAALAPILERLLRKREWQVLYICPTRALVNDLFLRLQRPVRSLGLTLERRTGDHRSDYWRRPHILITTPESFDSMLCRGNREDGHALDRVRAVVLDEVHLLHGTARGEQVKWLLWRLQRILRQDRAGAGKQVQVVALSATISDPEGVKRNYLNADAAVVRSGGGRSIEEVTAPCDDKDVISMLEAHLAGAAPSRKILVFCNSRAEVDKLAAYFSERCQSTGYEVRSHHGSISRGPREETEERSRRSEKILIFATSSLEIGIDIGDIDLVVLDRPPPDVFAFLQRIGRGNRRSERTRVMLCSEDEREDIINQALLHAARDGWMPSLRVGDCYSVLRQQIASYIFQSREKKRSAAMLEGLFLSRQGGLHVHQLIETMLRTGDLGGDGRSLMLGEDWTRGGTSLGKIHSNIEDRMGLSIVDLETGRSLMQGVRATSGSAFCLDRMTYENVGQNERVIHVRHNPGLVPDGGIDYAVSHRRMNDATHPMTVRHHLGLERDDWKVVSTPQGDYVFHLGGPAMQLFLYLASAKNGMGGVPALAEINEWYIAFVGQAQRPFWDGTGAQGLWPSMSEDDLDLAERILGRPGRNAHLPRQLRVDELRSWVDLSEESAAFQDSRWSPCDDHEQEAVLRAMGRIDDEDEDSETKVQF